MAKTDLSEINVFNFYDLNIDGNLIINMDRNINTCNKIAIVGKPSPEFIEQAEYMQKIIMIEASRSRTIQYMKSRYWPKELIRKTAAEINSLRSYYENKIALCFLEENRFNPFDFHRESKGTSLQGVLITPFSTLAFEKTHEFFKSKLGANLSYLNFALIEIVVNYKENDEEVWETKTSYYDPSQKTVYEHIHEPEQLFIFNKNADVRKYMGKLLGSYSRIKCFNFDYIFTPGPGLTIYSFVGRKNKYETWKTKKTFGILVTPDNSTNLYLGEYKLSPDGLSRQTQTPCLKKDLGINCYSVVCVQDEKTIEDNPDDFVLLDEFDLFHSQINYWYNVLLVRNRRFNEKTRTFNKMIYNLLEI